MSIAALKGGSTCRCPTGDRLDSMENDPSCLARGDQRARRSVRLRWGVGRGMRAVAGCSDLPLPDVTGCPGASRGSDTRAELLQIRGIQEALPRLCLAFEKRRQTHVHAF